MAAKFAEAAGQEVGKELVGLVFKGGTNGQLRGIADKLDEINRKIDYLTRLVESLPAVILRIGQEGMLDESYRYLRSSRGVFEGGDRSPLEGEVAKTQLYSAWLTIMDLETRPQNLIELPVWHEYVRIRFEGRLDAGMNKLLDAKIGAIDFAVGECTQELDRLLRTSEELSDDAGRKVRYFRSFEVQAEPLLFKYQLETKHVPRIEYSRGREGIDGTKPDPSWLDAQAGRVRKFKALLQQARGQQDELGTLVPIQKVLREYRKALPDPL